MIDDVYNYLKGKTDSIVPGYSESLPPNETLAVVYRVVGGPTTKTLSKKRLYTRYTVNAIVRGNQDSKELVDVCDSIAETLDMDQDGVVITLVTNEPQFAFTDDNGNLNYTITLEVVI